jgi:hypothetical protein
MTMRCLSDDAIRAIQREAYAAGQKSQMARIQHLTHERDIARRAASTAGVAVPKPWQDRMTEYYSGGSVRMRGDVHFKDAELAEWRALFAPVPPAEGA